MFTKTAYEEIFRYREFRRPDGRGWLDENETISAAAVKCYELPALTDSSTTMISDVAAYGNPATKVKYKIKAGTAGKRYRVNFRITTSSGQKFEDNLECEIK